jgi:cytochrome P450
VLSIANRDPAKFGATADDFDPSRSELDEMVGWNGALSAPHQYPRICPGQAMSLVVIKSVLGLIKEVCTPHTPSAHAPPHSTATPP